MSLNRAGGGGGIKSIQRGTLNTSNSALNTTINAVDVAKCILRCWAGYNTSSTTGSVVEVHYPVTLNATQMQWPSYTNRKPAVLSNDATPSVLSAGGNVNIIYWELTEYV